MKQFFLGLNWLLKHPNNKNSYLTILKVIWWKFNQAFFKLPVLVEISKDKKIICPTSSDYASMIVYTKWPEYESMNYLVKNLKKNSVFIDVGAGIGEHSILAAGKITQGKIVAFEPDIKIFDTLKANIRLNNLDKIVDAEQLVVTQTNALVGFETQKTSELNKISFAKKTKKQKAVSLDNYCQKNKIDRINLLKIDVEGAELLVLKGSKKLLINKKIEKIILELNPGCNNYKYQMKDTLEFLVSQKYKLFSENKLIIKNIYKYLDKNRLTNTVFAEK